ncbi:DUF3889 domain-containing protein [Bacillus sp. FJAT-27445]|uniref:DUF3889 domain-containing protein n=1 Tax=Bacillus sp. FJAT-27445 TaxID=1679166 RepID=UPI0009E916E6|nr:DUF3889 domain-containing protein [Bacillus sp. FJAT-27445]
MYGFRGECFAENVGDAFVKGFETTGRIISAVRPKAMYRKFSFEPHYIMSKTERDDCMRKLIATLIAVLAFVALQPNQIEAQNFDYEKYGRMALAIVNVDYPGDPITDYEYLGRKKVNDSEVADTFRFKVVEKGTPLYVRVIISHNLKAEKLVTLKVVSEKR